MVPPALVEVIRRCSRGTARNTDETARRRPRKCHFPAGFLSFPGLFSTARTSLEFIRLTAFSGKPSASTRFFCTLRRRLRSHALLTGRVIGFVDLLSFRHIGNTISISLVVTSEHNYTNKGIVSTAKRPTGIT
jgi:hypothetical protein